MAFITYSPNEATQPSADDFIKMFCDNINKITKSTDVILVKEFGKEGTHPHAHLWFNTTRRNDNLRVVLYNLMKVDKSENRPLIMVKSRDLLHVVQYLVKDNRKYNPTAKYPSETILGEELIDHTMKAILGVKPIQFIEIKQPILISRLTGLAVLIAESKGEFTQRDFNILIRNMLRDGFNLSPHMKNLKFIYQQVEAFANNNTEGDNLVDYVDLLHKMA